jgi:hypothetical protein
MPLNSVLMPGNELATEDTHFEGCGLPRLGAMLGEVAYTTNRIA